MATANEHPLVRLETVVLIGIGGFAGSNLRFFLGGIAPGPQAATTLLVNALGSLALGFILYEAMYSGLLDEQTQLVAATGFLSSFTTYSTFALEAVQSPTPVAVGYVVATYAVGFAAALVGRQLARTLEGVVER